MATDYGRWILNSTYYSARQRDSRLSQERYAADRAVNNARQQLQNVDREIAAQISRSQQEFDRRLNAERQRIQAQVNEMTDELQNEINSQRAHFERETRRIREGVELVEEHVAETQDRINDLAEEYERELQSIISRIEDQKERAIAYHTQLSGILECIQGLHPDKLAPDEVGVIADSLTFASADIESGDFEAAMGIVQSKIPDALQLRSRLELLNDEYSRLVIQIHELAGSIEERIQLLSNPDQNIVEVQNYPIPYDGRHSFWSSGVFDEIVNSFHSYCDIVRDEYEPNMDLENLRAVLPEMRKTEEQLNSCVSLAHGEFYESLSTQQLASRIHTVLTERDSWYLVSSGFAQDDVRKPYTITYEDGAGHTASVVVFQNREALRRNRDGSTLYGETQFRLSVFGNGDGTKADFDIVREGILARLAQENIHISNDNAQKIPLQVPTSFIEVAVEAGEKLRNTRIQTERQRMGLKQ